MPKTTCTVVQARDAHPYGRPLDQRNYALGQAAGREGFTGHERDVETGYDYHGARYYQAEIGRYLGVDVLAGRFASWSAYAYVMDNPVGLTDMTGMSPDGGEKDGRGPDRITRNGVGGEDIPNWDIPQGASIYPDNTSTWLQRTWATVKGAVIHGAVNVYAPWYAAGKGLYNGYHTVGNWLESTAKVVDGYGTSRDKWTAVSFGIVPGVSDMATGLQQGDLAAYEALGGVLWNVVAGGVMGTRSINSPSASRSMAGGLSSTRLADLPKPTIHFGRNKNQSFHTWRHVDELGLERGLVEKAVYDHFSTVANKVNSTNSTLSPIMVNGVRLEYAIFKLPDGSFNVGRINAQK
jgi:RHS repeat-associated protein